ncbi:hypothetical protein JTB14_006875 [Gonioctena quinquepunctata]|nr:hypothetical protein JTB14_006875 [Gonioctena quinquepunctata]
MSQEQKTVFMRQDGVFTIEIKLDSLKCEIWEKELGSHKSLHDYSNIHCGKRYVCDLCGKDFLYPYRLQAHKERMHLHIKKKLPVVQCDICGKRLSGKANLAIHIGSVHFATLTDDTKPKFQCPVCDKNYKFQSLLEKHIRIIHEGFRYECPHCKKSFRNDGHFQYHVKTHQPDYQGFEKQCEKCCTVFKSEGGYRAHMKRHEGLSYVCDVCGKNVTSVESLKRHIRTHTGERPYKCEECGKNFKTAQYLVTHKRVHTKEKPYVCDICNQSFTQKSSLTVHVRYHTGERPYKCNACSRLFVTKTVLKNHRCKAHLDVMDSDGSVDEGG